LERQRRRQVAVVRQAADVAAERAHHGVGRRLSQVQDLGEALGAQTVAALERLRPPPPQVVGAVADLTLQVVGAQQVHVVAADAADADAVLGAVRPDHHDDPKREVQQKVEVRAHERHGTFPIDGDDGLGFIVAVQQAPAVCVCQREREIWKLMRGRLW